MIELGIYPGTFDPLTNGHNELAIRAAAMCEHLILAFGKNPLKEQTTFSLEERVEMATVTVRDVPNISIDNMGIELPVDYAERKHRELGKKVVLIRGIRSPEEYKYESEWWATNNQIAPNTETVFLMPRLGLSIVSSSYVKQLAASQKWEEVTQRVSPFVYNKLFEKFGRF